MPHLVILYTPNLEAETDMTALCRALADTMLAVRDDDGAQVFPTGGTRVFAIPAAHYAVADGGAAGEAAGLGSDYGFVYLNLRMGAGRSDATKKRAGGAILERARAHLGSIFERKPLGLTVNVDEAPGQVFDGKHSSLHPLFSK
jgi:5-carboxymethyl-2-hydroxymuconate isomerase